MKKGLKEVQESMRVHSKQSTALKYPKKSSWSGGNEKEEGLSETS